MFHTFRAILTAAEHALWHTSAGDNFVERRGQPTTTVVRCSQPWSSCRTRKLREA